MDRASWPYRWRCPSVADLESRRRAIVAPLRAGRVPIRDQNDFGPFLRKKFEKFFIDICL